MKLITRSDAIKARIEQLGTSQTKIAEQSGWSRGTVNSIVKGRNKSIASAHKMAYHLQGDFKDFFDVEYEKVNQ
ncbi:helix-turn-helix domain-containing protein [Staphylococcus sp. LKG3-3]|uniref:helix-turn-helix domain-containing protein n=1 Tax=Staphylococcus sp. LKG3-3 TaxID=3399685 RepID=UPI003D3D3570